MTYNLIENLEYCREIVVEMLPLLYYTHIPASLIALVVGMYVLYKTRSSTGVLLFSFAAVFSLWSALNLVLWLVYDQNTLMIAIWSIFGLLSGILFFFAHWFMHSFITGKPLPFWMAVAWTIALSPIIIVTPTLSNLSGVDIRDCVAVENPVFFNYYYSLGGLAVLLSLISSYFGLRSKETADSQARSSKVLVLVGGVLFIVAFLVTGVLGSYLVYWELIPDFGLEQYGVASMAVFMGILAYATVRYHAFNLKLLAAQALVVSLVILIAAEFLFVTSYINRVLVGLTLGLAVIFGYLLVRSVKAEVRQRELIQRQEQELEVVNKQQENLLHFISHEIKGYLTKSEAGFAGIVEGDYGTISEQLTGMAKGALADVRKGVRMVMEILDASNLKKGTVGYKMQPFDLRAAVVDTVEHLKPTAEQKHIGIKTTIDTKGNFVLNGDEEKIRQHVLRNLIDNAIRYTPSGNIEVTLTDLPAEAAAKAGGDKLRFAVKDSGIGITPEDMKLLFTEGGHGKDSIKVNVHSTGYGLFIAKEIVEAHKGKIWAESEGEGKGARFIIEFPIA